MTSNSSLPARLQLELRFGPDFADLFEVKNPWPKQGRTSMDVGSARVTLRYGRDGFSRGTIVTFGAAGRLSEDRACFDVELAPQGSWRRSIEVSTVANGRVICPGHGCSAFNEPRPKMPLSLEEWLDHAPGCRPGTTSSRTPIARA